MRTMAAALCLLSLAGPALAETDQGAVSTAAQTDELISEWLKAPPASPDLAASPAEANGPLRDGKIHGEVGFSVGTGGYREAYGVANIPLGEHADATVAVSYGQGRGFWGPGYGSGYGPSYVRSLGLSVAAGAASAAGARPLQPSACAVQGADGPAEPAWFSRQWAASPRRLAGCPGVSPEG